MTQRTLTTEAGAPVGDSQRSQTAGPTGPTLLQDDHLIEKLARCNRERIPERVVHAVGTGAYGFDREARERLAQLARSGKTLELCAMLGDASPDVVNARGDSLLMLAAYHGHATTVHALLALGANPYLRSTSGLSPMAGAAFQGDVEVLDALLFEGDVDVDEAGPDGRTPLMWAAAFGRTAAVAYLLAHGADPTLLDHAGLTALTHARNMGADTVLPLLGRAA